MRLIDADKAKAMYPSCRGFCEKIDSVPTVMQKPLTLERVRDTCAAYDGTCAAWLDYNGESAEPIPCTARFDTFGHVEIRTADTNGYEEFSIVDYGYEFRLWEREFTEEEWGIAEWE